ncbi:heme exporter protein CcmD [Candidatus Endolissoclinum faulkneri]|nr:heme exporter protein CcmD [Candidatus Endolissoclinum faulkneri]
MEYFSMGGYAAYVWPSYGIAMLILVGLLINSWSITRRYEADLICMCQNRSDIEPVSIDITEK